MARSGSDVLVLEQYWSPTSTFEEDIELSELLSRGWVYQEVLLTSANLFCTPDQMWWSCFTSSLNQIFPKAIPEKRGHELYPFVDSIRGRKGNMMSPKEREHWLEVWFDIVSNYSATSVTFSGDRVVAIAGLAQVFASRFPNLQHAVCHSGVWSTDVVPQILWYNHFHGGHRFPPYAMHPIPSWSPLSGQGKWAPWYPTRQDNDMYVAEYVSMQTSGLDRFGRAKEQKDCVLHLRGVPLQIDLLTKGPHTDHRAHSFNVTGYEDQNISLYWDTEEETAMSTSGPLLALPFILSTSLSCRFKGLLLKPDADSSHRDHSETDRRLWVRCGWFEREFFEWNLKSTLEAFQLRRLGVTVVLNGDDSDEEVEIQATQS